MQKLSRLILILIFLTAPLQAKRSRKHTYHPRVTHPVVLWSRTLSESGSTEERRVAAFKLSQYSQPIYQEEVINTLIRCMKDSEVEIKVLCTKAMGRAGTQSRNEMIRKALIEVYKGDNSLRSTIVRVFIARKDNHPSLHEPLLESLKTSTDPEELLTLIQYFELHAINSDIGPLVDLFRKTDNAKVRRSTIKALAERGQGQTAIVTALTECAESKETPLALTCLAGLQTQARKDSKTWTVLEKTILSSDPDVLLATLDVIHALPDQENEKISTRLIELLPETEDTELLEKAILALGVCGNKSEAVVTALLEKLDKKGTEESIRVTIALVIGRQGVHFPEKPKEALSKCAKEGKSQGLKTACLLGMRELESRKTPTPTPTPTPAN